MYESLPYWFQHLTRAVTILTLLLAGRAPSAQAAGPVANQSANLGVRFLTVPQGLFVQKVTSLTPYAQLRAADQITSINGRRVNTEAAFLNQLVMSSGSVITIVRGGRLQTLNASPTTFPAAAAPGGGFINPGDLVLTSQGAMHKERARRLGLSGTPIGGASTP